MDEGDGALPLALIATVGGIAVLLAILAWFVTWVVGDLTSRMGIAIALVVILLIVVPMMAKLFGGN